MLPNRRTLAEVMSAAEPTPVRSKRTNDWRRKPAVAEFFTSSRVAWPKFCVAYVPSRTCASAASASVTVVGVEVESMTVKWTVSAVPAVPAPPVPLKGVTTSVWAPSGGVQGR